jgi:hypothetical protein
VQDNPSGQLKTQRTDAYVERVLTLVCSDQRVGVRVIAEELNVNRETVQQILKEDLEMRKISTKMVPRILTHFAFTGPFQELNCHTMYIHS